MPAIAPRFGTILLDPAQRCAIVPTLQEADRQGLQRDGIYETAKSPGQPATLLHQSQDALKASGELSPGNQCWEGAEGFFRSLKTESKIDPLYAHQSAFWVMRALALANEEILDRFKAITPSIYDAYQEKYDSVCYSREQQSLLFYDHRVPPANREGTPLNVTA